MPDFAPTATPRYKATYRSGGVDHSITTRGFRGEPQNATVARSTGVLFAAFNSLASLLSDDFQWTGAFYIPQDSEISVVASLPTDVTGLVALGDLSAADKITSLGFAGKSTSGSKTRLQIYGFNFTVDTASASSQTDFVLLASESSPISDAIDALNAGGLAAIDNGIAFWYPRTTIKINDHWLKQVRRGIIA